MSNQTDHTIVRLRVPPELKKQIEESSEQNNRSQSAEMVARLEKSFNEPLAFNPSDAEMVTKLVTKSMAVLIENLSNEGVDSEKIMAAIKKTAQFK